VDPNEEGELFPVPAVDGAVKPKPHKILKKKKLVERANKGGISPSDVVYERKSSGNRFEGREWDGGRARKFGGRGKERSSGSRRRKRYAQPHSEKRKMGLEE